MSKSYYPDSHFHRSLDSNLIYQLQNNGITSGMKCACNDVTIKIEQYWRGKNPMPKEMVDKLIDHLQNAANEFLYLQFGYPEQEK